MFIFTTRDDSGTAAKQVRQYGHAMLIFPCLYRPYKESVSKEMNNDNDN